MQLLNSWQVLLGISVFAYSFSVILQKVLVQSKKTDGVTYSIVFQLFVGIIIGIFALLHGFHMPNFLPYLPNAAFMILFYGFGNVCIFKALSIIDASEYTVLITSRAIWTVLASIVFLGEKFSFMQIIGTILILGAISLINIKKKKFTVNKGTILTLIGALFFGLAFVNDAYMLQRFDALSYLSIAFILPAIGMIPFYPQTIRKMNEIFLPGVLWKLLLFTFLYSIAAVGIFVAYTIGKNAAQLIVIDQSATILTVILAIILLKERKQIGKKLFAAILAFIGILLVG